MSFRNVNIKFIFVSALFLAVSGAASAQTPQQPAYCGIETARTEEDLLRAEKFFERFKKAIEHDRRNSVVAMVRFPLEVNGKLTISNRAALLRHYDKVFDPKVRVAIQKQRTECIFGNWQGFMAGRGAIWFDYSPRDPEIKIIAVNNDSWTTK